MQRIDVAIEGMSCNHCVARVRRTLEALNGVRVGKVEIGSAEVEIDAARTTSADIIAALDDAGYAARPSAPRAA
jgi:copper chaperone CopZ